MHDMGAAHIWLLRIGVLCLAFNRCASCQFGTGWRSFDDGTRCLSIDKQREPATYEEAKAKCREDTPHALLMMRYAAKIFRSLPSQRISWVGIRYSQRHKQYFWEDGTVAYTDEDVSGYRGTDTDYCIYYKHNKLNHGLCSAKLWFACEVKICDEGWKYNVYTNRCTKLFPTAKSAVRAAWDCNDNKAIIETIRDPGALEYYRSALESSVSQNDLWMGMSDEGEEGEWWWMDGSPVRWAPPFTKPTSNSRSKNCAVWKGNTHAQQAMQVSDCFNEFVTAMYVCAKFECEKPWQFKPNSPSVKDCYLRVDGYFTARRAGQHCSKIGGKIIAPKNTAQIEFVRSTYPWLTHVWIGLSKMAMGGTWQWADNTPLWRARWSPSVTAAALTANDCAVVSVRDGKWTPVSCLVRNIYLVCQMKQPYAITKCANDTNSRDLVGHDPSAYAWLPAGGRRSCIFHYARDTRTYADAYRHCAQKGGTVFMPKTNETNSFVRGYAQQRWGWAYMWLGLDNLGGCWNKTDCGGHNPSAFTWNDGTPVSYEAFIYVFNALKCVVMHAHGSLSGWSTVGCNTRRNFLCEVPYRESKIVGNIWDQMTACKIDGEHQWSYIRWGNISRCYKWAGSTVATKINSGPRSRKLCQTSNRRRLRPSNQLEMRVLALGLTTRVSHPWLGVVRGRGAAWRWDGGDVISESNWAPGEPRVDRGNCASLNNRWKWKVGQCEGIYKSIVCEASGPLVANPDGFNFAAGANALASSHVHVISYVMAVVVIIMPIA